MQTLRPLLVVAVVSGSACQRKPPPPEPSAASIDASPRISLPARKGRQAPPLPDPLAGRRQDAPWLNGVLAGGAGDLDGDGLAEMIVADAGELRVLSPKGDLVAATPAPGGIQSILVADADGDGLPEIVAAWGRTPERKDGEARVSLYRLSNAALVEEALFTPQTVRPDVVATIPPAPGAPGMFIAFFDSKYVVKAVRLEQTASGRSLSDVASIRMAVAWARGDVDGDRALDLVVARVYGDDQDADGDAFVLRPDGTRVPIPTTRGARSLALVDTDADGTSEIFLGDGWHKNYGEIARGLLTWSRFAGGAFTSEIIEDTDGQSSLSDVFGADIDGDGRPEIVTRGDHYVRVFRRRPGACPPAKPGGGALSSCWSALTVAGKARDVFAARLDRKPGESLVVIGERSEIIDLRGVAWP